MTLPRGHSALEWWNLLKIQVCPTPKALGHDDSRTEKPSSAKREISSEE